MTCTPIKTMQLYNHLDRVGNELAEAGYDKHQGNLPRELVHKITMLSYSGVEGCKRVVDTLGLSEESSLMDVGSGLAGPARVVADISGCKVTALEMQPDLHELAQHLTRRCGLSEKVEFVLGNILHSETIEGHKGQHDAVISWLAVLHIDIAARATLWDNVGSCLRPGGRIYIEDFFELNPFTPHEKESLHHNVYIPDGKLPTKADYLEHLTKAGFSDIEWTDLTSEWTEFVVGRLEIYKSSKERHVRVHNSATYDHLLHFYQSVADLFNNGNLGGVRIVATLKPQIP